MRFCPRCFKDQAEAIAKMVNYDPTIIIDPKKMAFKCQMPFYDHDYVGEPTVRIWNCETKKTETYMLKDYRKLQAQGLKP